VGWAQGRREATESARLAADEAEQRRVAEEARREAEHRTVVAALEAATAELTRALAAVCEHVEEQATSLALDLTRELVGHEVTHGGAAGQHVVRRALALMPDRGVARLRLHPDVAATVTGTGDAVQVVADPALGLGDALVETDEQVVDLRVATALDRLREVLQ
jgi:flagellar assembly protein FliH